MLSSNTGRLTPPKIEVRCTCGKRYRVSAKKAGKKVRCKKCRAKIEVPGGDISMRTRKAILDEFGIDASAAEHAYEEEKRLAGYVCVFCDKRIAEEDLKAAYGQHGLMCEECRVAQVQQRELGDPVENERKKQEKKKKKLDKWASGSTPEEARRKATAYGALFFCGITGLLWSFSVSLWLALPIAAVVAFAGARAIFNNEYTPEPEGDE
jgi:hypothetical protein